MRARTVDTAIAAELLAKSYKRFDSFHFLSLSAGPADIKVL
jgi:hypothetical protein